MLFFEYEVIGVPYLLEWQDFHITQKNDTSVGRDYSGWILDDGDYTELVNGINEVANQVNEEISLLNDRLNNLLYDPIPDTSVMDGRRLYIHQFVELLSTDQIDGLEQRLSFFTNALGQKVSGISASPSTGILIDSGNPQNPQIVANKPLWNDIRNKPLKFTPEDHSHELSDFPDISSEINSKIPLTQKGVSNGVASLDGSGKIPASQIPIFNPTLQIVNTIAERNALSPTGNLPVYVKNATADPTVLTGGAFYLYELTSTTWIKLSEMEAMDIIQSWFNIIDKPTTFPPDPHGHTIANITGLQTALDAKRGLGNIPGNEIDQNSTHRFVSDSEKTLWNNTIHNAGNISGSQSFAGFNSNRTYKATLIDNTTFAEISGGVEGNVYLMVFLQDSTGGRTISFPSYVEIPTGEAPDLGANKKSILTMYFDGTNYLGSWKKGWS